MSDYEQMLDSLRPLAAELNALHRRAVAQYAPMVEKICREQNRDDGERYVMGLMKREGDAVESYSFEELVAEFGASFLCAFAGIANAGTEALSASYIDGWAKAFRRDHRILLRAASAAQRAADYVRGKVLTDAEPAADQPPATPTGLAA